MNAERKGLFREAALDRLSTSDRLDRTLAVSSPKGWLALAVLCAITACVLGWSVLAEISTYVPARGILIGGGGGIVDAVSTGNGALSRVVPAVGDRVERGDVVAVVVNAEAVEQHRTAVARMEEEARSLDALRAAREAEEALHRDNIARQRRRYESLEASARASVETANRFLEMQERLFADGVVASIDLGQSQRFLDSAQRELYSILRERDDLELDEVQRLNERMAEVAEKEASLRAAEREVRELDARLATHEVLAPVPGRVAEIKVSIGAVLSAGSTVLSIRPATETLEALIYVPPVDGKRILPGMEALVSPSSARREEYGSIRGRVAEIAAFPASPEGMIAVLQSQDLARQFSSAGPPYAGRVTLEPDPTAASAFAWTSSRGADLTVSSGTLVEVEIEVERQRPIALVAPALQRVLGG